MDAKTWLSRAKYTDQLIRNRLHQLETLRAMAAMASHAPGPAGPVTHSLNTDALPNAVIRIQEAEEELNKSIDELVSVREEIESMILRLPDVAQRVILEKKYLCFMAWIDIADDMGYSVRWAQMQHQQALAQIQAILEESEESSV